MTDDTEQLRRDMMASGQPARDLEQADQVWTTTDLARDFTVHSFLAPFVLVTRKSDGARGSLEFTHSPRVYFNFEQEGHH